MLPRALGKYELRRAIGRGAMGEVYEAVDPVLRRVVAVKLLTCDLVDGAEERFVREARAAAALAHPNIVPVYELGYDGDRPFIVMQRLFGRSLQEEIAAGDRRTLAEKVRAIADVCLALDKAHAAGIVHRDVTPANLHVGDDGVLRLLDFGIAHLAGSALTLPNQVVGTPAYIAPEILAGAPADGRSDLYSLAAVLFEWLAGRRPFEDPDVRALFARILHDPPPMLERLCPGCPVSLADCVRRVLSKDPALRPQSARSFRADLLQTLAAAEARAGN